MRKFALVGVGAFRRRAPGPTRTGDLGITNWRISQLPKTAHFHL